MNGCPEGFIFTAFAAGIAVGVVVSIVFAIVVRSLQWRADLRAMRERAAPFDRTRMRTPATKGKS